jgi:hypothetical protein
MTQLTVYHGSNHYFNVVDLSKSKNRRDFGRGFYTTTLREQAVNWASSMTLRFGGEQPVLYEYKFDLSDDLRIKKFADLSEEWLEMIKQNRVAGGIQNDYVVVIGPVANDNTFRTITLYLEGDYTAGQAIEQLRFFRPNNQLSIHTGRALSKLTLMRRDALGK